MGAAVQRCLQLNVADRDHFVPLRGEPAAAIALYGPDFSRFDVQQTLALARALRRSDKSFAGVAIAVIPLQNVQTLLALVDLGPDGAAGLRTEKMASLVRHPALAARNDGAAHAIKFSRVGGSIEVLLLAVGSERLRIEFEDHRIGISEADQPCLFNRFVQRSEGASNTHQGTGPGLALVSSLLVAQGGTIGLRSVMGAGSVFHCTLPRQHVPVSD